MFRAIVLLAAALPLCGAADAAGLFRAYLASNGLDSNACTLAAPCRLLPRALDAVASGGEIWMLDSANYNTSQVVITKSVTILAVPGAVGSVVAASGRAIVVVSGAKVVLRNLVIVPLPGAGGWDGIYAGPGTVSLEDSVIAGHSENGIVLYGDSKLTVSRSIIRNNAKAGILLNDTSVAHITRSTIVANGYDGVTLYTIAASDAPRAWISDSVISGNTGNGIFAYANATSASAIATVFRSTLADNVNGLSATGSAGSAIVTVGGSTITSNQIGLSQGGVGVVESLGDNLVRQNVLNKSGVVTGTSPM
jgi:hypothetical protein